MHKILYSSDPKWNEYINRLPIEKQDVYFTSDYVSLYETNGDGTAVLFVYENGKNLGVYPFVLNKIEGYEFIKGNYYDIQSAYGYAGPVASTNDKNFLEDFESEFLEWAAGNNIVAEFIRFHPIFENYKLFKHSIETTVNRHTVGLDLSCDLDSILVSQISKNGRYSIRESQKLNLTLEINHGMNIFIEMYKSTMKRLNADKYYYFSNEYFKAVAENKSIILLGAALNGRIIACSMVMYYKNYAHYHLSCGLEDCKKYNPSYFLQWEAVKYTKNMGCRYYHLGGGRSTDEDDSLLKYKKKFSKDEHMFYIGKRIINQEIYFKLIQEWEHRRKEKAKIFLQYRESN